MKPQKQSRSAHTNSYVVPYASTTSRQQSFFPRIIRDWNQLPLSIKKAVSAFKAQLPLSFSLGPTAIIAILFFYDYYYYLKISDKLAKFYDVGWLLYQRILMLLVVSLTHIVLCSMPYSIILLFSYFHILFSYSKLYSKILFVPTATTWVE